MAPAGPSDMDNVGGGLPTPSRLTFQGKHRHEHLQYHISAVSCLPLPLSFTLTSSQLAVSQLRGQVSANTDCMSAWGFLQPLLLAPAGPAHTLTLIIPNKGFLVGQGQYFMVKSASILRWSSKQVGDYDCHSPLERPPTITPSSGQRPLEAFFQGHIYSLLLQMFVMGAVRFGSFRFLYSQLMTK